MSRFRSMQHSKNLIRLEMVNLICENSVTWWLEGQILQRRKMKCKIKVTESETVSFLLLSRWIIGLIVFLMNFQWSVWRYHCIYNFLWLPNRLKTMLTSFDLLLFISAIYMHFFRLFINDILNILIWFYLFTSIVFW